MPVTTVPAAGSGRRSLPRKRPFWAVRNKPRQRVGGSRARSRSDLSGSWANLKPLASRIRQRLVMLPAEPPDLAQLLDHLLAQAGNPALMTNGLKDTLVAHADGSLRTLTVMADALLATAAELEREVLDEKLFFDTWGETPKRRGARR